MRNVSRRCLVRACITCSLLALAGCHDYSWRADFAAPVERGLNEARILQHTFTINANSYAFAVPGELCSINLVAFNPAGVSLTYSLSTSVSVGPVTVAIADPSHATISFRPDETALGQDVVFTVSIVGATNGYVYPDYSFTLPCHYPEGNAFDVTFDLPDATSGALVLSAGTATIAKPAGACLIGPATGFDATGYTFAWYVDGALQAGATGSIFSFAAASWSVCDHVVSLVASRNGSTWSANVRITVEAAP